MDKLREQERALAFGGTVASSELPSSEMSETERPRLQVMQAIVCDTCVTCVGIVVLYMVMSWSLCMYIYIYIWHDRYALVAAQLCITELMAQL